MVSHTLKRLRPRGWRGGGDRAQLGMPGTVRPTPRGKTARVEQITCQTECQVNPSSFQIIKNNTLMHMTTLPPLFKAPSSQ